MQRWCSKLLGVMMFEIALIPAPMPNLSKALDRGVEGMRVGIVSELLEGIDNDVTARLHSSGCSV